MPVQCPKCRAENLDTARFCLDCGTSLRSEREGFPPTATLKSREGELAPKTLLGGRYEIAGKIGAGGMGEVYRARDRTLDREVALKILPDEFVGDPERVARFEREARLLASLNHPNIAIAHGFEEAAGKRFLVLELVEGETLAQTIARGPLPVEDALEVCRQIADGLEAAHEKGIVHRDLKPSNVKVTPGGQVKILDFGLAKAARSRDAAADPALSPTITDQMTHPGVVLGTAAYMSPEQAKGKSVDKTTDIWAFGCVLYECLAGRRAFGGETVTETVAAILKGEPDWAALPAETPLAVRAVLGRCLKKDARNRLRDIADARAEMLEDLSGSAAVEPARRRFPLGWALAIGAAALAPGFLAGPAVMKLLKPAASPKSTPVIRSIVRLEEGCGLAGNPLNPPLGHGRPTRTAMALSRDGRFLIYAASSDSPKGGGFTGLYLRKLGELRAEPIPGTELGSSPFLSPDDRWIGFWAEGKLKKVPVEGGAPTALCDIASPFGFTWEDDGWIVFSPSRGAGLYRVRAEGGRPEPLTTPDPSKKEFSHRLPHALPGGKGILFTIKRHAWDSEPRVAVLEPGGQSWRVLIEDAADARYIPSGHLVFLRKGTLMTARLDIDKLEVTGQPVSAVAGVEQALATTYSTHDTGAGQFCVSASGTLAYAAGGILPEMESALVWLDRAGRPESVGPFKAPFFGPRLSPDGRRIIVASLGLEGFLHLLDLDRGSVSKLTTEGMAEWGIWSPDGRRFAFDWVETGTPNLFWQGVDGSSPMERLTQSPNMQFPGSWSPDGRTLAFIERDNVADNYDILVLHVDDRTVTPFLKTRFNESNPQISPDGRWLAYVSSESGRDEVYVRPFPGPGGKWQVSTGGGFHPLWSRDDRELFYRKDGEKGATEIYAVDVRPSPGFSCGKPRLLFTGPDDLQSGGAISVWDISPDGRRFLMVRMGQRDSRPVTELVLVQNWLKEIERPAP